MTFLADLCQYLSCFLASDLAVVFQTVGVPSSHTTVKPLTCLASSLNVLFFLNIFFPLLP